MKLPGGAATAPAGYRGHSTTLVGIPAGLLASTDFNDFPLPLSISGTREANRSLFTRLDQTPSLESATGCFQDYMDVLFGFEPEQRKGTGSDGRRRFRSSYLRLLKGWGFDANSREAAVLKGWVESRFGLFPTFHKTVIARFSAPAGITYIEEKMSSRFHNNSINMQLDLLYEFCQWALTRFHSNGRKHLTLFRGTNNFDEHPLLQRIDKRCAVIRLNNLVSFSADRDVACQFGDYILEVAVPRVKILFFNELLPLHALRGESEYLAIGGDYRVKVNTL
ncbi:MAG: NAD(+)--dinitrogen-reductase ADP-D-ribosyltransferase [Proteobacteria bacterium]|nr:NAD(+)--dinitrogen-reductase ADP-D-ribosyltransferase [Pseudomonadota bacterium]